MIKFVLSGILFLSLPLAAQAANLEVEFGPYVGNGDSSDDSQVRYVSGFRAAVSRPVLEVTHLKLSPVLSFENSFFNTRTAVGETVTIADYDHRTFGLGLELSTPATSRGRPFEVFLRSSIARTFSKVGIDQSTGTSFSQRLISGVRGVQNSVELGASLPLQTDFFVGLSVLANVNRLDQSDSQGSDERETNTNSSEGLTLTSTRLAPGETGLADTVVQRSIGASVSASILF
jgi:hypothetical protein